MEQPGPNSKWFGIGGKGENLPENFPELFKPNIGEHMRAEQFRYKESVDPDHVRIKNGIIACYAFVIRYPCKIPPDGRVYSMELYETLEDFIRERGFVDDAMDYYPVGSKERLDMLLQCILKHNEKLGIIKMNPNTPPPPPLQEV